MTFDRKRIVKSAALAGIAVPVLLGAVSEAALAQVAQAPTREEILREQLDERLRTPGEGIDIEADLSRAPCPLADPQYADIKFVLREASFNGAEAIDPALLRKAWQDRAGDELAIGELCDIRDRAAELMREEGYVVSVQVPPQTIDDGTIEFDVVVARMTGLVIRGEPGPSGKMLRRYFERLRNQPVFRRPEAERILLLARDIPGFDVRLSLARDVGPQAQPGDLIGIVDVINTPITADANIQNYSTSATGRFGALVRAQFNGLTGLADLTEVSLYSSQDPSEQVVLQGRHEFGVGADGLRFGVSAVQAWTQPDLPGPDLFEAETFIGSIYASYPLVRRQTSNLGITVGFDWIDQDVEFDGLDLTEDSLRVPFLRLNFSTMDRASAEGLGGYNLAEPRLATWGNLEIRQGIDGLGASEGCGVGFVRCMQPGVIPIGRFDADPSAFLVRGDARIDFRPSPDWLIRFAPRFQYSGDPLLPYEQFSGGNFTVGRGYDPGDIVGDSGIGARTELAYGSLQPSSPNGLAWQGFVFHDTAAAWTNNVPGDPLTLNSVGAGVRVNIARRAYLEVLGAVPLERAPLDTERGDVRLLVNLSVSLGS